MIGEFRLDLRPPSFEDIVFLVSLLPEQELLKFGRLDRDRGG